MSLSFVRRIAIAALALPLLLGGCTDDEPASRCAGDELAEYSDHGDEHRRSS